MTYEKITSYSSVRLMQRNGELVDDLKNKYTLLGDTIGDLYNENVKKIDLDLLSRICQTLHCDISDLLEYEEEEENK